MSGAAATKQESFMKISDINFDHLFAGISGGVISTAVLHPLDLIKIRLQVNDGNLNRPQYKGLVDCARQLYKTSGMRGLYQGVVPNIWGAGLSWGLYFFFYNNIKRYLQHGDSKLSLGAGWHMAAAAQSGLLTLTLTNPIWVAKTRICLQYDSVPTKTTTVGVNSVTSQAYSRGLAGTLVNLWRKEGLAGLYKGYVPGIFGISHGVLQFVAYEELKKVYLSHYNLAVDTRLGTLEYLTFAALSKMFAVVSTYPYQVIRSRLQDSHREYTGVLSVIKATYMGEGWRGFYKGLLPNMMRVTPACCLTFVVYESIMTYLHPKPPDSAQTNP